jgi:hypothetical protein
MATSDRYAADVHAQLAGTASANVAPRGDGERMTMDRAHPTRVAVVGAGKVGASFASAQSTSEWT